MTRNGRRIFKECSKTIYQLERVRRVSDAQSTDKDIMNRVRIGDNIRDSDVERLLSLHVKNIEETHGAEYLKAIKEDLDLSDHINDAINSLRIVLAADESFRTGKTVTL